VKGSLQNTVAKSLFDPIPPDFCFCVLESQNAPNHHHLLLLLHILVLGMTTKNLSPTEFLHTFVGVFLNHKILQIYFICFYFVGPHIEQWWRCSKSFTFITLKSSGLFWGVGYPRKNLPIQSFFQISLPSHSCLLFHHCQYSVAPGSLILSTCKWN